MSFSDDAASLADAHMVRWHSNTYRIRRRHPSRLRFELALPPRTIWETPLTWARERVPHTWPDTQRIRFSIPTFSPALLRARHVLGHRTTHAVLASLLVFLAGVLVGRWRTGLPGGFTNRIEISSAAINDLRAGWQQLHQRPPTEDELKYLIDDRIRQEVYYREAMAGGLHLNDETVRQRLSDRAQSVLHPAMEMTIPDETALRQLFEQSKERYYQPARISFRHIFFDPQRRGPNTVADARAALTTLSTQERDIHLPGDPFPNGTEFRNRTEHELAVLFGEPFAAKALAIPEGWWTGPVPSAHGFHVVYVSQKAAPRQLVFEEVREKVLQDYLNARQHEARLKNLETVKKKYRIAVDP